MMESLASYEVNYGTDHWDANVNRRQFCTQTLMTAAATGLPLGAWASFHPGKTALMGRKRAFDPHQHYPSESGIVDPVSGCRFFFHHHRPDEFGHFHAFGRDEYGAPIHVIMITIDESGTATKLTTTNQWVTGTRYIDSDGMKSFIDGFAMTPASSKHPQLVEFIQRIVHSHRTTIHRLYRERDAWLAAQQAAGHPSPFTDKAHEELSFAALESA